ncbi:hypothetical protein EG328_003243 [Venturia inaequalis]|uniref:ENTH domain-containing protein n=1 Tax=Venturia inaequalis TaxID=5025 RepID=A0A8H3UTE9_VENIN|nr:hypothetical protein EG328_003243 [Venturia inaequalis]
MDFASLKEAAANISLYDLKAGVRKVQNAVMNYTEMEAKVREATNNEPWGASSTLMQEIATATFNYQLLNEIMPMIYKRFTEKSAEEWRQIYKGLQLLEFLVKNGSERVIDDARSHLSLLKMLRQFHFIDLNGKDQGINVRNRSKELVELLSDVEKIRTERKKTRGNRTKYAGYEGGGGLGPGSMGGGSGSRMGGFGSESAGYGQYNGGVYGDGGGFGGQSSDYQDTGISSSAAAPARRGDRFEEYDEYDEGAPAAPGRKKANSVSSSMARRAAKAMAPEPAKPKEPEEDLFDFGDEPIAAPSNGKAPAAAGFNVLQSSTAPADDDDFDDFQSATPVPATASAFSIPPPNSTSTTTSATQFAQPQPRSGTQGQNITDLFASISPPPPRTGSTTSTTAQAGSAFNNPQTSTPSAAFRAPPQQNASFQPAGPNYFTSVPVAPVQQQSLQNMTPVSLANLGRPMGTPIGGAKKPAGGDAFASLLGGAAKKPAAGQAGNVSMADMARQKASAGIWGASATSGSAPSPAQGGQQQQKTGGGLDDLLG